ncbi:hypothetical protein BYT27DRAFT_7184129 [Phlegmacium glaucopus]|nr:hypothetical protein BYT27DRAFT_7184129 [Phlegmacium glaucopus]
MISSNTVPSTYASTTTTWLISYAIWQAMYFHNLIINISVLSTATHRGRTRSSPVQIIPWQSRCRLRSCTWYSRNL